MKIKPAKNQIIAITLSFKANRSRSTRDSNLTLIFHRPAPCRSRTPSPMTAVSPSGSSRPAPSPTRTPWPKQAASPSCSSRPRGASPDNVALPLSTVTAIPSSAGWRCVPCTRLRSHAHAWASMLRRKLRGGGRDLESEESLGSSFLALRRAERFLVSWCAAVRREKKEEAAGRYWLNG